MLACADQDNDGLSSKEAVDVIHELTPDVTREAARRQIISYVLPLNSKVSVLKKCTQKVQVTTSNRTNINCGIAIPLALCLCKNCVPRVI